MNVFVPSIVWEPLIVTYDCKSEICDSVIVTWLDDDIILSVSNLVLIVVSIEDVNPSIEINLSSTEPVY